MATPSPLAKGLKNDHPGERYRHGGVCSGQRFWVDGDVGMAPGTIMCSVPRLAAWRILYFHCRAGRIDLS